MISYLQGKAIMLQIDTLTLLVNGIGYNVCVGSNCVNKLINNNSEISLFIYSITKEDGTTLYGFRDLKQKLWFGELIKINGISGRTAITIIDEIDVEQIDFAIQIKDENVFTAISGIGPKIASRIVIEAQKAPEKVKKQLLSIISTKNIISENVVIENKNPESHIDAVFEKSTSKLENNTIDKKNISQVNEIVEVMHTLGFGLPNISKIVFDCINENENLTQEEIIKLVIKKITCK